MRHDADLYTTKIFINIIDFYRKMLDQYLQIISRNLCIDIKLDRNDDFLFKLTKLYLHRDWKI